MSSTTDRWGEYFKGSGDGHKLTAHKMDPDQKEAWDQMIREKAKEGEDD